MYALFDFGLDLGCPRQRFLAINSGNALDRD